MPPGGTMDHENEFDRVTPAFGPESTEYRLWRRSTAAARVSGLGSSQGRLREDGLVKLGLGLRRLQARFLALQAVEPPSLLKLRRAALAAARLGPLRWSGDFVVPRSGARALRR